MTRATLHWAMIALTLITAIIHLSLGVSGLAGGNPDFLSVAFTLNFFGYGTLLAAVVWPGFPIVGGRVALTHYLLTGFTALTFVLFFVFNWSHVLAGDVGVAAIIAKTDEVLLITVTLLHLRATLMPLSASA